MIGTKSWRTEASLPSCISRTEGCATLLSPAYLSPPITLTSSRQVLKVHAGSGWTRIEDPY